PRLDLSDRNLRLAKELGCRVSVNTDAHAVSDFEQMPFGITQLRRAWLTPADVINTYSPEEFLAALRPRP
ncbi:DNA polymerase III, partial [Terriglobus sp. YAF25]